MPRSAYSEVCLSRLAAHKPKLVRDLSAKSVGWAGAMALCRGKDLCLWMSAEAGSEHGQRGEGVEVDVVEASANQEFVLRAACSLGLEDEPERVVDIPPLRAAVAR